MIAFEFSQIYIILKIPFMRLFLVEVVIKFLASLQFLPN
jgi:hypothetical protein